MSARRSLLFVVVAVLLGAFVVAGPAADVFRDPEEISNFRLMDSGPPVHS